MPKYKKRISNEMLLDEILKLREEFIQFNKQVKESLTEVSRIEETFTTGNICQSCSSESKEGWKHGKYCDSCYLDFLNKGIQPRSIYFNGRRVV